VIVVYSEALVLWSFRLSMLRLHLEAMNGILFAINRSDMRRIPIEIGSSNSKLFFVRIDPFPQLLAGGQSVDTCLALYAYDIGR
jgi:hypothetical protein